MSFDDRLDRIHHHIDNIFPDHIRKAQEFLRLPSVSGAKTVLEETAEWLRQYIKASGGSVELIESADAPILFARFCSDKPKTLLVYGMYDVHPVAGQTWTSPPFAADIRELPGIGQAIVARGACNSKGPLIALLNTIHAVRQVDEIPVDLLLTIEGEEESGSRALDHFYRQNRDRLRADAGFEPFWADYGTDVSMPTLSLGTKGIVDLELVCRGGDWGGPVDAPVHGSTAAWLASPTWRLIRALATLTTNEDEIAVEGLCDDIAPPSREDEELLRELTVTFDEQKMLDIMGARRFKYELHGVDLLRKYVFSPSIHVNSVTEAGGEVIPPRVSAHLSIRLVPEMDPLRTVEKVRKHLAAHGYGDIEVVTLCSYPWSRTSRKARVVESMIETYRYHGFEPQIRPLSASATPYYLFSEVLGIPYVWGGLGRAGRSHSQDEYAAVEGLRLLEKSIATFLYIFSR